MFRLLPKKYLQRTNTKVYFVRLSMTKNNFFIETTPDIIDVGDFAEGIFLVAASRTDVANAGEVSHRASRDNLGASTVQSSDPAVTDGVGNSAVAAASGRRVACVVSRLERIKVRYLAHPVNDWG